MRSCMLNHLQKPFDSNGDRLFIPAMLGKVGAPPYTNRISLPKKVERHFLKESRLKIMSLLPLFNPRLRAVVS